VTHSRPPLNTREYFDHRALQCRRLAFAVADEMAEAALLALADEYEGKAHSVAPDGTQYVPPHSASAQRP
jgi:hypothetical protein